MKALLEKLEITVKKKKMFIESYIIDILTGISQWYKRDSVTESPTLHFKNLFLDFFQICAPFR